MPVELSTRDKVRRLIKVKGHFNDWETEFFKDMIMVKGLFDPEKDMVLSEKQISKIHAMFVKYLPKMRKQFQPKIDSKPVYGNKSKYTEGVQSSEED